jgi:hypothetical protein
MKNTIMVNGKKKVCVIYDNGGETFDRYTVIFKAFRARGYGLVYPYIGASSHPFAPQGFGQHGESRYSIREPHLGKRIAFDDVPPDVQMFIIQELS